MVPSARLGAHRETGHWTLELMKQLIRSYQFSILLLGVYLSSGSKYQASAARGMVMRQIMGGVKTVPGDLNMPCLGTCDLTATHPAALQMQHHYQCHYTTSSGIRASIISRSNSVLHW